MKIIYTALTFILITASTLFAQAPLVKWQKCLGGILDDFGNSMAKTADGGYILAGETYSYDGDVNGNHPDGHSDFWVVKLTSLGSIEWQKCLGGYENDAAYSIVQTSEGGYIVAGYVFSDSGDVSGNHGSHDFWVVKLSDSGSIEWKKCFGGSYSDVPSSIIQTLDGGFAVTGQTNSSDGDVKGFHGLANFGSPDAWVVKLTPDGQIQWQRSLGGSGREFGSCVIQTADSGFVIAGSTNSNNGDLAWTHDTLAGSNGWLVKLSSTGDIQWQQCYGGDSGDSFNNIIKTRDGGFIVTGTTNQFGTTWDDSHNDLWVVKLDSIGTTEWQRIVSGNKGDFGVAVTHSIDGGYVVCGSTNSENEDIGSHGIDDIFLVKLDSQGVIEWKRCYGGSDTEYPFNNVIQNENGSIIIGGRTDSKNGDVSGLHGIMKKSDFWIAELGTPESVENTLSPLHSLSLSTYPNPASQRVTLRYVLPAISSDVVISITDINGKQTGEIRQANVMQGSNEVTLDVSELSEGTYYITVSADGISETTSVRVVK